ncbi:MAG TPA: Ldh family oxidoreductase [Acidimicrobiales bacterium]
MGDDEKTTETSATPAGTTAETRVVEPERLRRLMEGVLAGHGVPAADAAVVADNLLEADLRGVDSHGCHLLALYVDRLRAGHLEPVTAVTTVRDDGSTVVLDGGLGFGQVAGVAAMDLAVERAREHGTAAVAVRESTHLGALAYYTERAAAAGCVALAVQNGPTIVPPHGSVTPLLSTNPISYAVPAGEEPSIVFDAATTTVAGNRVLLAKKRGDATIPAGWANDERGRPTTDTAAASVNRLQWFGGHKGYGIALFVEVLAGVLTGSSFGRTELTRSPAAGAQRTAKGYVFLALDVGRFLPVDEFRARVDTLVRDIAAAEPADGVDRVLVPGQLEHERRAARRRAGIPLSAALVAELDRLAAEAGCPGLGA